MNVEQQIQEINEEIRAYIKPSPVHGIGVFALRNIKAGEKCYCFPNQFRKWYSVPYERLNEIRPEIREVILARWPSIINGSHFLSPNDDVWLASFINFDPNPNYLQSTDSAIRDIKAGEEITEDYRIMKNYAIIYPWLK